ncbi:MAG: DUF3037 domain-containing protein [Thioalkalivibrio sp.]|nr:DUF3037 domain-containing protein [Thioalkalivibrio sp.]
MASRYTIFQYVPDLISGERINFGVAAYDEDSVHVRFLNRWSRVREFAGKDIGFLKHFAGRIRESADASSLLIDVGSVTRLDHELITKMAERWIHSIQVTEPRASMLPAPQLADQIAAKVLRQGGRTQRAARRKAAQQAAVSGVRAALDDATNGRSGELLKPGGILKGELTENKFDAVVQNGTPILAAHGISFQGQSDGHATNAVNAISFMLSDVRHLYAQMPLALVAIPPRSDLSGEYQRAQAICKQINVAVVAPDMVEEWARPAVRAYFG